MAGGSAGGRVGAYGLYDPTRLAAMGRVFYASDGAAADKVLSGTTSFGATTPTFQLNIPTGTTCIPLMMSICQSGTVAGGAVDVIMEFDNAARYSSVGTAETMFNARTDLAGVITPACTLRTNPTAASGYGVRVMGLTLGQDVSPAEGAVQEIIWTPAAGMDFLVGPAAWNVFTYAAVTAPTWLWTFKWAEIPSGEIA